MRYEVSQEPKDVEPGDIAVMRLVTTKGAVSGRYRTWCK